MARGLIDLAFDLEDAVIAELRGDATLVALLNSDPRRIRQRMTFQELLVPSVGVFRVADDVNETEVPVILQFDFWAQYVAATDTTALNAARAIRSAVLHAVISNYTFVMNGLQVWTRYAGGRRHEDPKSGVAHLSGDVEFHPYRTYN